MAKPRELTGSVDHPALFSVKVSCCFAGRVDSDKGHLAQLEDPSVSVEQLICFDSVAQRLPLDTVHGTNLHYGSQ